MRREPREAVLGWGPDAKRMPGFHADLSGIEQILERLVVLEAIRAEISPIGGQYPAIAELFGEYDER